MKFNNQFNSEDPGTLLVIGGVLSLFFGDDDKKPDTNDTATTTTHCTCTTHTHKD